MYRFALLAGVFAMLPATAFAELPPLIPRDVLFGNPDKAGPQISPDGKHLAYLAPDKKNVLQVWVRSTKPPKGEAASKAFSAVPAAVERLPRLSRILARISLTSACNLA